MRQASSSLEDLLSGGFAKVVEKPWCRALTYLGESSVGNVAVERVQWNFAESDGAKITEVLAFDARGFLRAVNTEYTETDGTIFRQAEMFTNLQVNPRIEPQTFALVLPKGARLLTVEQMQADITREYEVMNAADAKNSVAN